MISQNTCSSKVEPQNLKSTQQKLSKPFRMHFRSEREILIHNWLVTIGLWNCLPIYEIIVKIIKKYFKYQKFTLITKNYKIETKSPLTASINLTKPGKVFKNSTWTHVQHLQQQHSMPPAPWVSDDAIFIDLPFFTIFIKYPYFFFFILCFFKVTFTLVHYIPTFKWLTFFFNFYMKHLSAIFF